MKTLLVFNDGTPQGTHAAKFALVIARGLEANILVANACKTVDVMHKEKIFTVDGDETVRDCEPELTGALIKLSDQNAGFRPEMKEMDVTLFNETQLAEFSNKEQIWMIIRGATHHSSTTLSKEHINFNTLMNKVRCPLLMVPLHWSIKQIERMVYIADLRYCRIQFVRFLIELAKPWSAIVSIANLSAKGLPDMREEYATAVFKDEICANVKYDNLLLNNIREKDLTKAVDVMINGLHNDLLVMVNHRFHFEEIVGPYITEEFPELITIPLLIFPY
jgi:hypothetical protein